MSTDQFAFIAKEHGKPTLTTTTDLNEIAEYIKEHGIKEVILLRSNELKDYPTYFGEKEKKEGAGENTLNPNNIASLIGFYDQTEFVELSNEEAEEILSVCKEDQGVLFAINMHAEAFLSLDLTLGQIFGDDVEITGGGMCDKEAKTHKDKVRELKFEFFLAAWRGEFPIVDDMYLTVNLQKVIEKTQEDLALRKTVLCDMREVLGDDLADSFLLSPKVYTVEKVFLEQVVGYDDANDALKDHIDNYEVSIASMCKTSMRRFIYRAIVEISDELVNYGVQLISECEEGCFDGKNPEILRTIFQVAQRYKETSELIVKKAWAFMDNGMTEWLDYDPECDYDYL